MSLWHCVCVCVCGSELSPAVTVGRAYKPNYKRSPGQAETGRTSQDRQTSRGCLPACLPARLELLTTMRLWPNFMNACASGCMCVCVQVCVQVFAPHAEVTCLHYVCPLACPCEAAWLLGSLAGCPSACCFLFFPHLLPLLSFSSFLLPLQLPCLHCATCCILRVSCAALAKHFSMHKFYISQCVCVSLHVCVCVCVCGMRRVAT